MLQVYDEPYVQYRRQHGDVRWVQFGFSFLFKYKQNHQYEKMYLPPANEVWGKVMFLLASVILSRGGGGLCMMSLPVWLPGPMFLPGGFLSLFLCSFWGSLSLFLCSFWGSLSLVPCSFRGVSIQGVSLTETPRDGKERVVRILLECILVTRVNFLTRWHHWRHFPCLYFTISHDVAPRETFLVCARRHGEHVLEPCRSLRSEAQLGIQHR